MARWCASTDSGRFRASPVLAIAPLRRKRASRRRATYVKRTTAVLAFDTSIRRRDPERLRTSLVNDNLSLRAWAAWHNVDLVPTPTSASHLNHIACHFRPLRECVLNASADDSHSKVTLRHIRRRSTDHHTSRIRTIESMSRVG
jgi:hypothetical protein